MTNKCKLCGEPMSEDEQMFIYHGYSGPCPKPPLKAVQLDPAGVPKIDLSVIEREALSILGIVQILHSENELRLPPDLLLRIEAILMTASVRRSGA